MRICTKIRKCLKKERHSIDMNELTIEARTENLHQLFDFVVGQLEQCGCDKPTIKQCKLCAEEIFMNVSSYAYHPGNGPVMVTIRSDEDDEVNKLVMTFSDNGKPFDPLKVEAPDVDASLDERGVGGLGIFLVVTTMDDVSYEYKDGQNILTVKKNVERKKAI